MSAWIPLVQAQDESAKPPAATEEKEAPAQPERVDVEGVVRDDEIAARLQRILDSTEWYDAPVVEVDNGVVFLNGLTDKPQYKEWAGNVAQRTQDVVAVVNRITVREQPTWNLAPAMEELHTLWREFVQQLPLIVGSLLILLITIFLTFSAARIARVMFRRRDWNPLLLNIAVKVAAFPLLVLGLYIMLRVSGLTNLAMTVLGGTGLFGIIIGIAFRDIAENFLASILISVQRPFRSGDTIEVDGHRGVVQKVTTRGTLMMAFDGTYVHIPNSKVYKSTVLNITANPKTRLDFVIGIGYDASATEAQNIALRVLKDHQAILNDPEPMILIEELGAATVNIRAYFWIDGNEYSPVKVKSSVMRLMKRAYQQAGISLPDEAREVIFPNGVPVTIVQPDSETSRKREQQQEMKEAGKKESDAESSESEASLKNETAELQSQALESQIGEDGQDLLVESKQS